MSNAVDLDQLERDVRAAVRHEQSPHPLPSEVTQYAPKRPNERMPLEIIAQAITRLTWADAEAMGSGIATALESEADVAKRSLAAAIQAWASGYLPKQT